MRSVAIVGLLSALTCAACGKAGTSAGPITPSNTATATSATAANDAARDAAIAATDGPRRDGSALEPADRDRSGTWIGAAAEGEMLHLGTRQTNVGVWVDVPAARNVTRPPMEVALVIDTSGSMVGAKMENAKVAAASLVRRLRDGDIVALDTFSDTAKTIVPPTVLDTRTRTEILRAVSGLSTGGSTNMFEGLNLAEGQVAAAPATHALRRVVVISDGIANVGPSSPETLGAIAENGLRFRAQVTSLGVGTDYDERTLNALSRRSSGRLYHVTEPREMVSIVKSELDLLDATLASDAFVEIVPAAGVRVIAADGAKMVRQPNGAIQLPLGALHAGQHREALVRVELTDPASFEGHARPLASVRLHFRDAQDGDVERTQEIIARTQLTDDNDAVARTASSRTQAIVAIQDASRIQLDAAQHVNGGRFNDADKALERAEQALSAQAATVASPTERKRLGEAAGKIAAARSATKATAAAPAPVQRDQALKLNADAMHSAGF